MEFYRTDDDPLPFAHRHALSKMSHLAQTFDQHDTVCSCADEGSAILIKHLQIMYETASTADEWRCVRYYALKDSEMVNHATAEIARLSRLENQS